jgi:hypothetical protein
MKTLAVALLLAAAGVSEPISIGLANGTERERQTKARLETILASYDLQPYAFAREVTIADAGHRPRPPALILSTRFSDSSDDLLSAYLHQQFHWYLRQRPAELLGAAGELRWLYPSVPVGLPEGAKTAAKTYSHLVSCYLEIHATRRVLGDDRTSAVVKHKDRYTWVYRTVLDDESRISAVVRRHGLKIE